MSPSGVPARSTGFLIGQCGFNTARIFCWVASESTKASRPNCSAVSVAITPWPPPSVRIAIRLPLGFLQREKASATSSSSLGVSTRMTPAWFRAASKIFSLPAKEPVCDTAARAPASLRPILMAAIGLFRVVRRAFSRKSLPSLTESTRRPSMYIMTTRVSSSWPRYSTKSAKRRSIWLPMVAQPL